MPEGCRCKYSDIGRAKQVPYLHCYPCWAKFDLVIAEQLLIVWLDVSCWSMQEYIILVGPHMPG